MFYVVMCPHTHALLLLVRGKIAKDIIGHSSFTKQRHAIGLLYHK